MQRNWRSLIRPKRIEIDEKTHSASYAEFTVQPLERGYGITLGNSLRRVLLSSIQGAAIVSVRFDKVLHEFSSIPGVKEDVTDIILNLKGVRLKLHGDVPRTIKIDAAAAGPVKAGDIVTDAHVEVLNPDHHIATLTTGGKMKAEMVVKMGKGYVMAKRERDPSSPRAPSTSTPSSRPSRRRATPSATPAWARSPILTSSSWRSGPTAACSPRMPSPLRRRS